MNSLVLLRDTLLTLLTELVGVGGALNGAKAGLYQNDVTPMETMSEGDFTAANYTGYAQEAITWSAPTLADDGTPEVLGVCGEFRPTAATVGNTIYGATLFDTAGTELFAAARFADSPLLPIPMQAVTDAILITFRLRFDQSGGLVVLIS